MSRVLIGNLPPGTTIRNIDDFCSPYGRLLYVDVKNKGNATLACVEYENQRNALNLVRARHGYNFNGYSVQLKLMDDSGSFEVRDNARQQNELPSWSNNNQMFNNGMPEPPSSFNYGGVNRGGNAYSSNDCGPALDENLDYNETCRIVFERFLREGYNRQVAKEKTLDFVSNIQRGSGQGFNYLNSNYFDPDQDMMNSSNFGNYNNNGSQTWSNGNNYDNGGPQMFPNSNWGGNFNGLNDQQMPSSWGGFNNGGGGGMTYPMSGGNFSGRPVRAGYDVPSSFGRNNIGGTRNNAGMANPKMGPKAIEGSGYQYDRYAKSLVLRKKIQSRIRAGNKTVRDLKNLQFHNEIISAYENSVRQQKKPVVKQSVKQGPENQQIQLQRYKSALGTILKYKKHNLSQLTPEERKTLASNRAIVDEYEKSIKQKKSLKTPNQLAIYNRKKNELIKQAKLNYPYDFRLSGAAKKKMRLLTLVGVDPSEAKHLALHSSVVVQELIELKKSLPNVIDKTKQLVPYKGPATTIDKSKTAPNKAGAVAAKTAAADIMAKKMKAGYKSANKVLRKHEDSDLSKLTDKEKAIIRISLRRLRTYNQNEGREIPKTRFDYLLKEIEAEDSKPPAKKESAKAAVKKQDKSNVQKVGETANVEEETEQIEEQVANEEDEEAAEGGECEEYEDEGGSEVEGNEETCEGEEADEEDEQIGEEEQ